MTITLELPKLTELRPRITVIGVGGAGCNAVNNMISAGLTGVDFVVANTDAQALATSSAEHRVQLGTSLTEGLGAGAKPEIGEAAAEEAIDDIRAHVAGAHMVFVAAGMGGGTGTGAASVIARAAKEMGVLAVGVVTKPFQFEGARRMRIAEAGIAELRKHVDTLIVIPNQNLFRIANDKTTFSEAFVLADQVLYSGVACIVDLIIKEGLINLDFADVRAVMSGMGTAMMGTGEASGERRAITAAEEAIANPLLDDVTLKGAKGLLLSITGGRTLTLYEVDEAATRVRQEVDPEANIIVGATFDDLLGDRIRVSIVASGMPRAGEHARANMTAAMAQAQPLPPPSAHRPAPAMPGVSRAPNAQQGLWAQSPQGAAAPMADRAAAPFIPHAPAPVARDEVQRRLTEALQQGASAHDPVARDVWHAPGGVIIEAPPPAIARDPNLPPPLPSQASTRQEPAPPSQAFSPAPPAEIRRPLRRMPALEDFPAVAQREYRSKFEVRQAEPRGLDDAVWQPEQESGRRPGLLSRLAGKVRRKSDSDHTNGRSAPRDETESVYGTIRDRNANSEDQGTLSRSRQQADLPEFFSRKRS